MSSEVLPTVKEGDWHQLHDWDHLLQMDESRRIILKVLLPLEIFFPQNRVISGGKSVLHTTLSSV